MLDHCWNIVALFGHLHLLLLLMIRIRPTSIYWRFTRTGFKLISYDDRCAHLGIDRLERRRSRADVICYKILHGLVFSRPY